MRIEIRVNHNDGIWFILPVLCYDTVDKAICFAWLHRQIDFKLYKGNEND